MGYKNNAAYIVLCTLLYCFLKTLLITILG